MTISIDVLRRIIARRVAQVIVLVAINTAVVCGADPAAAKRIALLVGNDKYAKSVGALKNPGNDVNLVAAALNAIGFARTNIQVVINADRVTTLKAIDDYIAKVAAAGPDAIAFFYYSGHGAASKRDGRNYVIPLGVTSLDSSVWYQAIALDDIVSRLSSQASNAAHFVIFDACRNLLQMPTKGGKGFLPVSTRRGMLIAFSTDPGETASDAGRFGGPYATALAKELVKPGLDHLDLFQNVKERVYQSTGNQVPWERNGLLRRVYLNSAKVASGPSTGANSSEAAVSWAAIRSSNDLQTLRSFITRYKESFFADLARQRLARLNASATRNDTTGQDDFRLTAPKWKGVKQFRRLTRTETTQRLSGYTVIYTNGNREFFDFSGSIHERTLFHSVAGGSTWRVGQNGRIYLRYKAIRSGLCSGYMSFNPATNRYRIDWREPDCSAYVIAGFAKGNTVISQ